MFMTNGSIFWKSRSQSMIAKYLQHAEYITLVNASNYGYILLHLMKIIKTISNLKLRSDIVAYYEDNQSNIIMDESETPTKCENLMDIDRNVIKDSVATQEAAIVKIGTENQITDILTKPTSIAIFDKLMPYILELSDFKELIKFFND